jgi:hypothetical protein
MVKKLLVLAMLMFTLYWPGTRRPLEQGERVKITFGEFRGKHGRINYTWSDGSVDVIHGFKHYYVLDYHWLEQID